MSTPRFYFVDDSPDEPFWEREPALKEVTYKRLNSESDAVRAAQDRSQASVLVTDFEITQGKGWKVSTARTGRELARLWLREGGCRAVVFSTLAQPGYDHGGIDILEWNSSWGEAVQRFALAGEWPVRWIALNAVRRCLTLRQSVTAIEQKVKRGMSFVESASAEGKLLLQDRDAGQDPFAMLPLCQVESAGCRSGLSIAHPIYSLRDTSSTPSALRLLYECCLRFCEPTAAATFAIPFTTARASAFVNRKSDQISRLARDIASSNVDQLSLLARCYEEVRDLQCSLEGFGDLTGGAEC